MEARPLIAWVELGGEGGPCAYVSPLSWLHRGLGERAREQGQHLVALDVGSLFESRRDLYVRGWPLLDHGFSHVGLHAMASLRFCHQDGGGERTAGGAKNRTSSKEYLLNNPFSSCLTTALHVP